MSTPVAIENAPTTASDLLDAITERTHKIRGVVALMGCVDADHEAMPDDALDGAAWAVRDLLKEVDALVDQLGAIAMERKP